MEAAYIITQHATGVRHPAEVTSTPHLCSGQSQRPLRRHSNRADGAVSSCCVEVTSQGFWVCSVDSTPCRCFQREFWTPEQTRFISLSSDGKQPASHHVAATTWGNVALSQADYNTLSSAVAPGDTHTYTESVGSLVAAELPVSSLSFVFCVIIVLINGDGGMNHPLNNPPTGATQS